MELRRLAEMYDLNFDKMNGRIMVALTFGGVLADLGLMSLDNFWLSLQTLSVLFDPCRVVSLPRENPEVFVDCDRDTLVFNYKLSVVPEWRYGLTEKPCDFAPDFLVPAAVYDQIAGRVAMIGAVNREALERTHSSSKANFYSREKNRLWQKGETSGNVIEVKSLRYSHRGEGAVVYDSICPETVCHLGNPTCFVLDSLLTSIFAG